ncbi:MAG: AI-2E family transporter [Desulfomicrobium escambiense]|nr:AI-2E family transporter [Desulfomicrobium escambiense]
MDDEKFFKAALVLVVPLRRRRLPEAGPARAHPLHPGRLPVLHHRSRADLPDPVPLPATGGRAHRPGPDVRRPLSSRRPGLLERQGLRRRAAEVPGAGSATSPASWRRGSARSRSTSRRPWRAWTSTRLGAFLLKAIGPFFGVLGKLFLVFLFLVFIVAGRGRAAAKLAQGAWTGRAPARSRGDRRARSTPRSGSTWSSRRLVSLANGVMVWIVLASLRRRLRGPLRPAGLPAQLHPQYRLVHRHGPPRRASPSSSSGPFGRRSGSSSSPTAWTSVLGNIIEPRIMGKGLGLSPLLVFFSLLFWGWLWGIPGMILSVPLTAVIKIVCQNVPALRPVAVLMGP